MATNKGEVLRCMELKIIVEKSLLDLPSVAVLLFNSAYEHPYGHDSQFQLSVKYFVVFEKFVFPLHQVGNDFAGKETREYFLGVK